MAAVSDLLTMPQAFVGGEIGQRMYGRPDDPKYQQGAAKLHNLYVEPSGTVSRLPGSGFIRSTRNRLTKSRLIPFRADAGQDIQIELGFREEYPGSSAMPGYARLHRNGATVLLSTAWSSSATYAVSDLVTHVGVLYRCKVAHTNQTPPAFTYWESLAWVPQIGASTITTGSPGTINFGAEHGLNEDEPVEMTGTAAPGGTSYGSVYYTLVQSLTSIRLKTTPGGAAIPITTTGTSTTVHRRYTAGNVVSKAGSVWYCRTTRPIDGSSNSIAPDAGNETYWYLEPSSGVYELPWFNNDGGALFELTYSQHANVLSLATRNVFGHEVTAVTPSGFDNYLTWQINSTIFAPPLSPPSTVAATPTKRGTTLQTGPWTLGPAPYGITTTSRHELVPGIDHVYVEGTGDASVDNKWWRVGDITGHPSGAPPVTAFLPINPDTGVGLAAVSGAGSGGTLRVGKLNSDDSNSYVVSAVDKDRRESLKSSVATATNNLFTTGAYNTITWSAVGGAERYRIYKQIKGATGLYGLIGESTSPTFKDDNIAATLDQTPRLLDATLGSATDTAPRAVTNFQGRRWFAGTGIAPQDVWGTVVNTESDMTYGIPVKATDRIHERLKADRACTIRHLMPFGGGLAALADTTEFVIAAGGDGPITPDNFWSKQQSSNVGAAAVQPQIMQSALLFVASRGGHVFQIGWREELGGYVTADLCERASHLFDGYEIVQVAAQLAPIPILWCVTSDGRLLGLTFVPSQQVWAWHWHETQGVVESVSVGTELGEDRVYLVVRRTIAGVDQRYVERMGTMRQQTLANSFFVDSGLQYAGSPVTVITGLSHLEGRTVAVLADGLVQTSKVVASGQITLDTAASNVVVGLPSTPDLQTLPATFTIEAYGGGKPKNVSKVFVRVKDSGAFTIGPSLDDMVTPPELVAGSLYSGLIEVRVPAGWTHDGQLFIRQNDPLPLTIVSMHAEMAVG